MLRTNEGGAASPEGPTAPEGEEGEPRLLC